MKQNVRFELFEERNDDHDQNTDDHREHFQERLDEAAVLLQQLGNDADRGDINETTSCYRQERLCRPKFGTS